MTEIIPIEDIQERISMIRGHKVMMDSDLTIIYGVTTKRLNEQVKRNLMVVSGLRSSVNSKMNLSIYISYHYN